ncbi:hypothetical protein [Streptomyces fradiae]|uniref:hypothetical protein n=1 Tax=Streptomyces fradiae TaxID=1906 RepID=UPI0039879606
MRQLADLLLRDDRPVSSHPTLSTAPGCGRGQSQAAEDAEQMRKGDLDGAVGHRADAGPAKRNVEANASLARDLQRVRGIESACALLGQVCLGPLKRARGSPERQQLAATTATASHGKGRYRCTRDRSAPEDIVKRLE